jgi:hypothetical protein
MSAHKVNGLPLSIAKELLLLRAGIERTELLEIIVSSSISRQQEKRVGMLHSFFKLFGTFVLSLKIIRMLRRSNSKKRKFMDMLPLAFGLITFLRKFYSSAF